jgi:hypothetical protein
MDDYINSLNKIVSRIQNNQSKQDAREKVQSWRNFLEELRILDRKYHTYKHAKSELEEFNPQEEKPPNDRYFPDLCAELQYKLVESAREFHLQIYSTTSSFMKFLSTSISEPERRGLKIGSVNGFYTTVNKISNLNSEIQNLQRSYDFRVFITHPTLSRSYDWMTFQSQVIYFHPAKEPASKKQMEELQGILQNKRLSKYVPVLAADDFKCPPEPETTYDSLLHLIKNVLRKLGDH